MIEGMSNVDLLSLAIVLLALLSLGVNLLIHRKYPYRCLRKNDALLDAEKYCTRLREGLAPHRFEANNISGQR